MISAQNIRRGFLSPCWTVLPLILGAILSTAAGRRPSSPLQTGDRHRPGRRPARPFLLLRVSQANDAGNRPAGRRGASFSGRPTPRERRRGRRFPGSFFPGISSPRSSPTTIRSPSPRPGISSGKTTTRRFPCRGPWKPAASSPRPSRPTNGSRSNRQFAREFTFLFDLQSTIRFDPKYAYPRADKVVDKAIEWIGKNRRRDYFLYLHVMDTHFPHLFEEDAAAFYGPGRYEGNAFHSTGVVLDPNARTYGGR